MIKIASFHPALFLVFWTKFHPTGLFRTARLFDFSQNSTLRPARLFGSLEYSLPKGIFVEKKLKKFKLRGIVHLHNTVRNCLGL